ncbi:Chain length determinant protein [Frateuria terrea]|uniref:Chain length determinant protein n=2 Tax=Frateuria terrea TaxID=529704 RepID=A0A1H6WZP5_9GAMM|nr:Chain length determinant protein [Frateuria terrea]SFP56680.1 Chain length determinant protein [Frateuria terrea]
MEHDEIYLIDLWRVLRREWRWFVAVLVVVLGLAIFFAQAAHSRWEAVAWIRPGQLGPAPAGEDPRVEPFQRVIERMQTVEFQEGVLHDLGISPRSREGHLYRGSFDLSPSPYAGLLKLTLRGYSPQQARRFVQATFDHLQRLHEGLMAEPLGLAQARLRQAQAQLRDATAERDRLRDAVAPAHSTAAPNRQDLLLASMVLSSSNQEVRGLQQVVGELEARLTASYSYETQMAWPVYVPDHAVYPNRLLIWGAGLVLGLGLGLVAAVARNAYRRRAAGVWGAAPSTPALRAYAQGERSSCERSPAPR